MALIEYRIVVDQNGTATVLQDVREIGPEDRIQFVANNSNTSIQFEHASPFANPGQGVFILVPQATSQPPNPLQVTNGTGPQVPVAQPVNVTNRNAGNAAIPFQFDPVFQENRRTFHFHCGQLNGTVFTKWGGQGGNTSSGGSGN